MNAIEQTLLKEEVGDTQPRLVVRSRTPVDTGLWWLKSRLWLLVMDDEIVLISAKRRRYIRRIPLEDCSDSLYCHDTGNLMIAPAEGLEFNQIAMPVSDAVKVLRYLGIDP